MKKLLTTTLALVMVGAFCLAMTPATASAGDPPDSTIKNHGEKSAVTFKHSAKHKEAGCTACHASDAGGKIPALGGGADDKAAKKAGHDFCKKCHDGTKAFKTTKCKNCHK